MKLREFYGMDKNQKRIRKDGRVEWIRQKPKMNMCQGFPVLVNESHVLKSECVNTTDFSYSRHS